LNVDEQKALFQTESQGIEVMVKETSNSLASLRLDSHSPEKEYHEIIMTKYEENKGNMMIEEQEQKTEEAKSEDLKCKEL